MTVMFSNILSIYFFLISTAKAHHVFSHCIWFQTTVINVFSWKVWDSVWWIRAFALTDINRLMLVKPKCSFVPMWPWRRNSNVLSSTDRSHFHTSLFNNIQCPYEMRVVCKRVFSFFLCSFFHSIFLYDYYLYMFFNVEK